MLFLLPILTGQPQRSHLRESFWDFLFEDEDKPDPADEPRALAAQSCEPLPEA